MTFELATRETLLEDGPCSSQCTWRRAYLKDGNEQLIFHADSTSKHPHKRGNDLTPFETSDSLLEEFADELTLLDPIPPGKEENNFDFEADLREIEFLLNQDPSTKSNIKTVDPILEKFTNEPSLDYLPPPGDADDDLFDLKSDNDEGKNFCMVIVTRTLILRKIKTRTLQ
nr:hypothetical protein [Tanacetum cinerariifolium]